IDWNGRSFPDKGAVVPDMAAALSEIQSGCFEPKSKRREGGQVIPGLRGCRTLSQVLDRLMELGPLRTQSIQGGDFSPSLYLTAFGVLADDQKIHQSIVQDGS